MLKKNQKIAKSVKNLKMSKTVYENLEKYGSFSEFRTSMEKSVMLATMDYNPVSMISMFLSVIYEIVKKFENFEF